MRLARESIDQGIDAAAAAIESATDPQWAFEQADDLQKHLTRTADRRISMLRARQVARIWKRDELSLRALARRISMSAPRASELLQLAHAKAAEVRAKRYPWRWYEAEVDVPGLDKKARIDEYDPILGEVVDDKTAGSRKWDVVGDQGPADSAWGQVLLYGLALDELGLPIQSVRIIVINRDTGMEEHFRRAYDPAAARRVLDDLIELATMLDLGVVPARDGTGPGTDWQCRSCFALSHCWNVPAAMGAARTPESYTLLGEDPSDETIVWAAERLLQARAAVRAAKDEEDYAKELVEGIEPGEYGEFVISRTRREMPNYKESFERLVELYALSEEHRPPVAEVARPLLRIDRYTSVRRQRAAKRGKAVHP